MQPKSLFIVMSAIIAAAYAQDAPPQQQQLGGQPGGQQGPGQRLGGGGGGGGPNQKTSGKEASTECTVTEGMCAHDGSSNSMKRSLMYDATSGIFTGHIITNQCANNNRWGQYTNGTFQGGHPASCVKQTFPAPDFAGGKKAAPLRGIIGYSMTGGVDIYGPFEAGFKQGMACTNNKGICVAGLDVATCESTLIHQCGAANFKSEMMMDSCGGHAKPYHYHLDLACDYDHNSQGHSALIGLALDGRGIYGLYETTGVKPTDLDACGGHYGKVPPYIVEGVMYPGGENVYHYHTQTQAPFTLGCFGPVDSVDECKALYPDKCNQPPIKVTMSDTCAVDYVADCPCWDRPVMEQCFGQPANSTTVAAAA